MVRAWIFLFLMLLNNSALLLLLSPTRSRLLACAVAYTTGTSLIVYLLFSPRSQWLVASRSAVECPHRKCVALTFDDGPSAENTARVLDLLRDRGLRATFFVIGRRADEHPELVRRAQREGHAIANHTWSHSSLFCFLTPGRLRAEITGGQDALERICGVRPRYFRSPVGMRHAFLGPYLEREGLTFVTWRSRAYDTLVWKPETLMKRLVDDVAPGDIILLHDGPGEGVARMLDVLPRALDELQKRGFEITPLEPAAAAPAPVQDRR